MEAKKAAVLASKKRAEIDTFSLFFSAY